MKDLININNRKEKGSIEDLFRVSQKCDFDIEGIYDERGGFWINEHTDGTINPSWGAMCGWEKNIKCSFYYENINAAKKIITQITKNTNQNMIDKS